jgi:hypothetical protein
MRNAIANAREIFGAGQNGDKMGTSESFLQHPYTGERDGHEQLVRGRVWPGNGVSASAGGRRPAWQKPSLGESSAERFRRDQFNTWSWQKPERRASRQIVN